MRFTPKKSTWRKNNMACQQAKFTDAAELARFIAELVQLGTDFDCVQISAEEWLVDLTHSKLIS